MEIKDYGKGFDIREIKLGNGLNNLKKRASEMKGNIQINSIPNVSTSIILSIPI
jgi:signal transduction histidine kinase